MKPLKIMSVVGARPNFMKIAPFCHAIERYQQVPGGSVALEHLLVHTGQHYDVRMSQTFFESLGIPTPDIDLEVGSGSHAQQVGNTMIAFEKVLQAHRPDWVVVVGDVNATCACSITAKKEGIKVAHIEAGLRSFDLGMPEEINRMVTDRLSDLLLTPDRLSNENLRREGVAESRIVFVGNIMIDTLEAQREAAARLDIDRIIRDNLVEGAAVPSPVAGQDYGVMTLHRPSNVDRKEVLGPLVDFFREASGRFPLLWPIHPRTLKQLQQFGLLEQVSRTPGLILLHPLGYHDMLRLNMDAAIMLTDSGGLQEECCVLGTPCMTLRWNTERPITLSENGGASVLVGNDVERLRTAFGNALQGGRRPQRPELWDGHTADRILAAILGAQA